MRFKTLSLIGTAALLAAPLTAARAQYTIPNNSDVCGGNNYTFCVSITGFQGTGVNANNFFITIINEALHGSSAFPYNTISLTSLGFDGFATAPLIFAALTSPLPVNFVTSNNITDLSDFPGTWVGAESQPPPVKTGLLFGNQITFEFVNTTAATFHSSNLAIHAQAGPAGCSSKMEFSLSSGAHVNGTDFISSDCSVTATPEPATLAMFGTGLASMMGMGWRRRKRDTDDSVAS